MYAKFYLIIVPNNEETKEKPPFLDGYWYKTSMHYKLLPSIMTVILFIREMAVKTISYKQLIIR
jgi:hypothetical protein